MKNIFTNSKYSVLLEIICIIAVFIIFSLLFTGHYKGIFTDIGREMIIPEGISQGKVLYRDILCIYSPLAYLLNALGFGIFGANIYTLELLGSINGCLFLIIFYFLSKEFFSGTFSALLTFTVFVSCVLSTGIFNFVLPYSYSMTYGLTGYIIAVYLAVLYLKTEKSVFISLAFLFGGYSFTCKSEFFSIVFILFAVTLFLKPLNYKKNILNLMIFLIIPLLTLLVLFVQGVTLKDLIYAVEFIKIFFTTPSMIFHVSRSGGLLGINTLLIYKFAFLNVLTAFFSIFACYFISKKFTPFLYVSPLLLIYIFNKTAITFHLIFLPILILVLLVIKFKELIKKPKVSVILTAAVCVSIRAFYALQISVYGSYAIPMLLMALFVFLKEFLPVRLSKEDIRKLSVYCLCTYSLYFVIFNVNNYFKYNTPIKTEKGTLFTGEVSAKSCNTVVDYLKKYTNPEDKVLVLPEGTIINFLAERPVDYGMHMADRLYYEALGADKVLQNIKNADYEVIILLDGFGLTKFGSPYLYDENNPVVMYIKNNYKLYLKIVDGNNILQLYQKAKSD